MISAIRAHAEPASVLLPPPADTAMYDQSWDSLNSAQRRRLSLYGLRFAPLDPRVWGLWILDATESKNLIPIRPFYLRVSEDDSFRLAAVEVEFEFKKVSAAQMEKYPREHDPVLEIGFAGQLERIQDRSYAIRLSAFPDIASGFYQREFDRYTSLEECSVRTLESGRVYQARLEISSTTAALLLDGQRCAVLPVSGAERGLVFLQTSWSPVRMRRLEFHTVDSRIIPNGIIDTSVRGKGKS